MHAPDEIRTHYLSFRKRTLYPNELQGRVGMARVSAANSQDRPTMLYISILTRHRVPALGATGHPPLSLSLRFLALRFDGA